MVSLLFIKAKFNPFFIIRREKSDLSDVSTFGLKKSSSVSALKRAASTTSLSRVIPKLKRAASKLSLSSKDRSGSKTSVSSVGTNTEQDGLLQVSDRSKSSIRSVFNISILYCFLQLKPNYCC